MKRRRIGPKKWKDALLSLLFPAVCPLCGERAEADGICGGCRKKYAAETFLRCPVCGSDAGKCVCSAGFAEDLPFNLQGKRFLALTWYIPEKRGGGGERVTDAMILKLKDSGAFADFFAGELAREIGRLFASSGEDPEGWVVSWCPRSPEKFMKTGFDQGEELARRLADRLGCGARSLFVRAAGSAEQKSLGPVERRKNAAEGLILRGSAVVPGMKVILTDDIVTTGATVRAAADLLYGAGAEAVFPAVIARTLYGDDARSS